MSSELTRQLLQIRQKAGLTHADLAMKIGLARPTVTQIEGGKITTTRVLEAWAQACGATVRLMTNAPDLACSIAGLTAKDQELVAQLVAILPTLTLADRRTLALLLEGWSKVVRSDEGQETVKSIKR